MKTRSPGAMARRSPRVPPTSCLRISMRPSAALPPLIRGSPTTRNSKMRYCRKCAILRARQSVCWRFSKTRIVAPEQYIRVAVPPEYIERLGAPGPDLFSRHAAAHRKGDIRLGQHVFQVELSRE